MLKKKCCATLFGLLGGWLYRMLTVGGCLLRKILVFKIRNPLCLIAVEMPLSAKCEFLDFVLLGEFLCCLLSALVGE